MTTPNQCWDAGLYDDKHAFVWQYGASLVGLLAPKPGERILDLGCGTGHLTSQIAQAGATVVGLDQSAEMLEQARSAYTGLQFIQGDARDFTFADPFDAIFSNAALHWIRPPEAVIRRVRDALRPGGRFVAEFGGRGNVQRVLAALRETAVRMGMTPNLPQSYFPSLSEYATLLEAGGLEVRSAVLFDRPTPLAGTDGLRDWVKMFRGPTLESLPAERREEFLQAVEQAARPDLFRDGGWVADYRRLRMTAVRLL
jgi:trans-aconitate methyltransferase